MRGQVHKTIDLRCLQERKLPDFYQIIEESLAELRREYEIVVIEGAGSPAEINLREQDVANMKTAHLAGAPVLLVET